MSEELEKSISVYDLPELDEQPDAIQDSNYLRLDVHYINGSSKGSYIIPFKSIGKYFANANTTTFGTVKIMTLTRESLAALTETKVTQSSVLANHAISFAFADNRYIQLIDAEAGSTDLYTDAIGEIQKNKVIKTNAQGILSKSFFNFDLMRDLSGFGRAGNSTIITSIDISGESSINSFYKSFCSDRETGSDFILFTRYPETSTDLVNADYGVLNELVAKLKTYDHLLLSGENGIRNFKVDSEAADQSVEWAKAYSTGTPDINVTEGGNVGHLDLEGSYIAGVGTVNAGSGNILTGYNFVQACGVGVFGTGIQNTSADHFSFITGILNVTKKSYANFTTGRGNRISFSNYSFLSGVGNTITDGLSQSLMLSTGVNYTRAFSTIGLGRNYILNYGSSSIIGLQGVITEDAGTTTINTRVNGVYRSILFGQGGKYNSPITDSVVIGSQGAEGQLGKITRSFISVSNANLQRDIEKSLVIGNEISAEEVNLEGELKAASLSALLLDKTKVVNSVGSYVSTTGSDINGTTRCLLIGSGLRTNQTTCSILIAESSSENMSSFTLVDKVVAISSGAAILSTGCYSSYVINIDQAKSYYIVNSNLINISSTVDHTNGSYISATTSTVSNSDKCSLLLHDSTVNDPVLSFIAARRSDSLNSTSCCMILSNEGKINSEAYQSIITMTNATLTKSNKSLVMAQDSTISKLINSIVVANNLTQDIRTTTMENGDGETTIEEETVQSRLESSFISISDSELITVNQSLLIGSTIESNNIFRSTVVGGEFTVKDMNYSLLLGDNFEVDEASRSVILGTKLKAERVNDSLVILRGAGSNSNIRRVDQSILIGDVASTVADELNYIQDSIVIGDNHFIDTTEGSIVVGDTNTLRASNYTSIFGKSNTANNLIYSLIVGNGNDLNGNKNAMGGTKSYALVGGYNNKVWLVPSGLASTDDTTVLGSNNQVIGKVDSVRIIGSDNVANGEQTYTDNINIFGSSNRITVVETNTGAHKWEGIYCIGSNNTIEYYDQTSDDAPTAYAFGAHLTVKTSKTGSTQYFGFWNDAVTDATQSESFACQWNYHKGEITHVWGMGTDKKAFTGMLLGRKGNCWGAMKAQLWVDGAISQTGADYAEYFERAEEIPHFRFVTLIGDKVKLANCTDDVMGIQSEDPGVLGNAKAGYNHHTHESIGLLGQLQVEDDGTCIPNGYCQCKENGIATKYNGICDIQKWKVMKRIDENHVLILFK